MLSNDIAIDFGTRNTRIYIKGRGLVLEEPSVIAIDSESGEPIAVGNEAYAMIGKTPPSISIVFPLSHGVICECTLAEELLKAFIRKVCKKTIIKPRLFMALPASCTDVEGRALRDAAIIAGARCVYIMKAPIAAAVGSKCDVTLSRGLMIINIGAGLTEFAAISLGQLASVSSTKTAGNSFTDAVLKYFLKQYSLLIGYPTAEAVKQKIGCVYQNDKGSSASVKGIDVCTDVPIEISVTSDELSKALLPVVSEIAEELKNAVDAVPSELLGDILEDGILLTGAAAKMSGLTQRLHIDTELKLFLAPESEYSVIRGLAALAENIKVLPDSLYKIYHS